MRPKLPSASDILPYIEAIDAHRWYSNWGALVSRLEEQLARRIGLNSGSVITASSGTAGLTAALLARDVPEGSFCIMPSWTFAATPHAARAAGLTPWFLDVDPGTWMLDPDVVHRAPTRPGSVIVVSPFGAPVDLPAWETFENSTGIPVVIDAAAGFDTVRASAIPCVVSLHATKILGAGEGGFIATTDAGLADRIRACCNFGFRNSRTAEIAAINGKMSEYHAAVALASLAAWPSTHAQHLRIAQWYRDALAPHRDVALQNGYGIEWASSTTNVLLPAGSAAAISQRLLAAGIETRSWWGAGCHQQAAFQGCPRQALSVTEDLGARVLGLPHFVDMQREDVDRVARTLSQLLASRSLMSLAENISAETHEPPMPYRPACNADRKPASVS